MKIRTRPLKQVLLYYVIIPAIAFFVIVLATFSFLLIEVIQENTFRHTKEMSQTIQKNVDESFQYMDALSYDIAASAKIQEVFSDLDQTDQEDRIEILSTLTETITPLLGKQKSGVQVRLYSLDNGIFSAGAYYGYESASPWFKNWYDPVMVKHGEAHISIPYQDEKLSQSLSLPSDTMYVSLLRVFFGDDATPLGIIEVQQLYTTVYRDVITLETKKGQRLLIFDNYGYKIFPLDSEDDNYYYRFSYHIPEKDSFQITSDKTGKKEFIQLMKSDFSEQSFVFVLDKESMLAPVYRYQIVFVLLSIVFMIILSAFLFYVMRVISDPIRKVQKQISRFKLQENDDEITVTSGIEEINDLSSSFCDMKKKLNESMAKLLLVQSQELQSKILLLQNQINPHFLYNSLAVISAMAEDGMKEEIVETCDAMADILRYISADDNIEITLSEELEIVQRYLSCMEFRYQENLQCVIQIDPSLYCVQIPKLVLQLLVENSIKYSTSTLPPWSIQIIGTAHRNGWTVSLIDSGPGFDINVLRSITKSIDTIKKTHLLPSLKLDGMGLLNAFMRLYLKFGDDAVFEIKNNMNGGATITVGILRKEES